MRGKPSGRSEDRPAPKKLTGPGGAAKKRMGQKEFQETALRLEDWSKFKAQLTLQRQADDYPVGWAGDPKDLKKKQALWAEKLANPEEEEEELNVADTNIAEWKQV